MQTQAEPNLVYGHDVKLINQTSQPRDHPIWSSASITPSNIQRDIILLSRHIIVLYQVEGQIRWKHNALSLSVKKTHTGCMLPMHGHPND